MLGGVIWNPPRDRERCRLKSVVSETFFIAAAAAVECLSDKGKRDVLVVVVHPVSSRPRAHRLLGLLASSPTYRPSRPHATVGRSLRSRETVAAAEKRAARLFDGKLD